MRAAAPAPRAHRGPGPYIPAATTDRLALELSAEMGPQPARVLRTRLMTVAAASRAAGQQGAGALAVGDRLVWVRGPWMIFSCVRAPCPSSPSRVYYVVVDAKTGALDGTGYSRGAPGMP